MLSFCGGLQLVKLPLTVRKIAKQSLLLTIRPMSSSESIFWSPGDGVPTELSDCKNIFYSAGVLPRLLAWISTNDSTCSLLDGYNAICYSPPTLMFASSALPPSILLELKDTKRCSLSAVTTRESKEIVSKAMKECGGPPDSFPFSDLDLLSAKNKEDYPAVVANSPIHMYCTLRDVVDLTEEESMILLTVETFVIDGSVLSPPTEEMKTARSAVRARIDAGLIRPWVGLGNGQVSALSGLADMPRPTQTEQGQWESAEFKPLEPTTHDGSWKFGTVEWSFRKDGRECSLGYNPVTALIMPRPIGWISTFRKEGRVPHVAPYSFFCDVARGKSPMVAFSGHRPNVEGRKDAQQDSEDMGFFGCNLVTHDLAVPMNYSAAPLPSHQSEFELAGLSQEQALLIDAPLVANAKIKLECQYFKTIDVPSTSFSIIVGRVLGMHIDKQVIHRGSINVETMQPITRLGYMNEYGVLGP